MPAGARGAFPQCSLERPLGSSSGRIASAYAVNSIDWAAALYRVVVGSFAASP